MKRLLLSLSMVAWVGAAGSAAFAQSALTNTPPPTPANAATGGTPVDQFESELQAFEKKTGSTPSAAPAPSSASSAQQKNPPASPAIDSGSSGGSSADNALPPALGAPISSGSNPLGPAGNLPVNKQMPLTANALNMQAPVESQTDVEAKNAERKKKFDEQAFDDALGSIMPMSPEEIRKLLDVYKATQQAVETPIADPVPKIRIQTVSLDPSQVPPIIRTSPGRVTTLSIVDSTGQPWPIQDVSWAGKFDVTPPEEGGNIVRITPETTRNIGNISMRLVDLPTPITFTLTTGLEVVDYRFDARIPKLGPLAKTPLIEHGGLRTTVGGDENLVQILDGTPPSGAEKMKVDGTDGRSSAWKVGARMYLRTPLTLLSPAWSSSVASGDGMNVYVLNNTPVVLLSDEGRVVRASITASEVTP